MQTKKHSRNQEQLLILFQRLTYLIETSKNKEVFQKAQRKIFNKLNRPSK